MCQAEFWLIERISKGRETGTPQPARPSPASVTLATGMDCCRRINPGWLDPATVNVNQWRDYKQWLAVPRAGEMLYPVALTWS